MELTAEIKLKIIKELIMFSKDNDISENVLIEHIFKIINE